jgi:hypothetical protein
MYMVQAMDIGSNVNLEYFQHHNKWFSLPLMQYMHVVICTQRQRGPQGIFHESMTTSSIPKANTRTPYTASISNISLHIAENMLFDAQPDALRHFLIAYPDWLRSLR